jgi:hypothetical protein
LKARKQRSTQARKHMLARTCSALGGLARLHVHACLCVCVCVCARARARASSTSFHVRTSAKARAGSPKYSSTYSITCNEPKHAGQYMPNATKNFISALQS